MNKKQLSQVLARKTGLKAKDTHATINALIKVLRECLDNDDSITLVGVGAFRVAHKEQRNGVNPSNGNRMIIRARKQLVFSASSDLKQMENDGK